MSALISSFEHALAVAASDTVKAAKFVEVSVLPVLKKAQADQSTIESITELVSPQAANIERAGFAVLGVIIKALDDANAAASASGLSVTLDAQLVADIKAIAPASTCDGGRAPPACKKSSTAPRLCPVLL